MWHVVILFDVMKFYVFVSSNSCFLVYYIAWAMKYILYQSNFQESFCCIVRIILPQNFLISNKSFHFIHIIVLSRLAINPKSHVFVHVFSTTSINKENINIQKIKETRRRMSVECHEIVFDLNVKRNCFHKNHNSECTTKSFFMGHNQKSEIWYIITLVIQN